MKRILLACAAVIGAVTLAAPQAAAAPPVDDPYGWHAYRDRTASFTDAFNAASYFDPAVNYRRLLISPYGTGRLIECRGDGHYVALYDCRQYDVNNVPHNLDPVANPFRPLHIYR